MVCLAGLFIADTSSIVLPALTFLFFFLSGHLQAMGLLGEMALRSGDYRPGRLLASIKESSVPSPLQLGYEK
jgi:hypothetical protein